MTQITTAMALYLVLLAGLALHDFTVTDLTETSSVGKQIAEISAAQQYRRDRE